MKIDFQCTGCGKRYSVDASLGGKRARCKSCGAQIEIPLLLEAEPMLLEPDSPLLEPEPSPLEPDLSTLEPGPSALEPLPSPLESDSPFPNSEPAPFGQEDSLLDPLSGPLESGPTGENGGALDGPADDLFDDLNTFPAAQPLDALQEPATESRSERDLLAAYQKEGKASLDYDAGLVDGHDANWAYNAGKSKKSARRRTSSSSQGGFEEKVDTTFILALTGVFTIFVFVCISAFALNRMMKDPAASGLSNSLSLVGMAFFLLPVPVMIYHVIRIAMYRRMDFAGAGFFHRLSPRYQFYFLYCGAVYPELVNSQIVCFLSVIYTGVLIFFGLPVGG